ncbi:MAG: creatininase family protein, partial [Planctomycetes bacterium]|nr:creatininase family protein [Planctomycetota bacterium]
MAREVRYEWLRPAQIVEARQACPVAYVPIGTIEWHGVHNPIGLDTLKIHALCIRCAQQGGGLVFPPLFYGENREEALMEANYARAKEIAEAMGLPPENFAPGYMKRSAAEQNAAYHQLLLHILREAQSLGFKVVVLAAGHYPLIDHARAAACVFHQEQRQNPHAAIPWVFTG